MISVESVVAPPSFDGSEGLLALIVRGNLDHNETKFVTAPSHELQVGVIKRYAGDEITPHVHLVHNRLVKATSEVLVIRKGSVLVNFYTSAKELVGTRLLRGGDVLVSLGGGHGFQFTEETEVLEVKQGPYAGVLDKVRF